MALLVLHFAGRSVTSVGIVLLYLLSIFVTGSMPQRVAPGDEDQVCVTPVLDQEILMASFNYRNLLEGSGGPWTVVDEDDNNDGLIFTSLTTVSLCSYG